MALIGFGGGCHWCTEAVFQPLMGVRAVSQGFIQSDSPFDSWSEAVELDFDPDVISTRDLIMVHLTTHASASSHKMRDKYRSAVYVLDRDQKKDCEKIVADLSKKTQIHFITQILMHRGFKPSDERFHNYYQSKPEKPFCKTYIEPKLAKLRKQYKHLLQVQVVPAQEERQ
ncbi:MAG: peptide-methionine (S)-S-oxide reductase [Cohaesibacter sp.]|nr:peptide-methionine (S)-S-oxide reductase [Cohaesibacter sp.]MCV6600655.1 peptide-methionine (S)-S-oxide reductase [Cohaesibacter sp.]